MRASQFPNVLSEFLNAQGVSSGTNCPSHDSRCHPAGITISSDQTKPHFRLVKLETFIAVPRREFSGFKTTRPVPKSPRASTATSEFGPCRQFSLFARTEQHQSLTAARSHLNRLPPSTPEKQSHDRHADAGLTAASRHLRPIPGPGLCTEHRSGLCRSHGRETEEQLHKSGISYLSSSTFSPSIVTGRSHLRGASDPPRTLLGVGRPERPDSQVPCLSIDVHSPPISKIEIGGEKWTRNPEKS